ncbi:DUF3298 domain-containing protein [candidate division KSB1 bacterium]
MITEKDRKFYSISGGISLMIVIVLFVLFGTTICSKFTTTQDENTLLTIEPAVINESTETRKINIEYPQVRGLGQADHEQVLNDSLRQKFLMFYSEEDSVDITLKFEVILNRPEILSIKGEFYRYKWRMANGINRVISVVFDRSSLKMLHLNDILYEGFELILNRYIKDYLDENMAVNFFKSVSSDQSFCLSETGLEIYFDEYEAAPGSEGIVIVPVPHDSIAYIVKPNIKSIFNIK